MATIGVDPATGRITLDGQVLDRHDPRMWGALGPITEALPVDNATDRDPRYWMRVQNPGDDSGGFQWQLRPEVQRDMAGRVQLGQTGIGGYGEALDPSRLEWDDRYGVLTRPENIGAPNSGGLGGFLSNNLVGIVSAMLNPAIAMGSGSLFQAGGMFGPSAVGEGMSFGPGGGLDPETWAGAGGMGSGPLPTVEIPGLLDPVTPSTVGEGFGFGTVDVPPLMENVYGTPTNMMQAAPSVAGAGFGSGAGAGAGSFLSRLGAWAAANPMAAAQMGMGAVSLLGGSGMFGGQQPGAGGMGGGMTPVNLGNFNFGGGGSGSGVPGGQQQAGSWAPNPHTLAQWQALYGGGY